MAVSDGVFDEGTFDNATFNSLTREETATAQDTQSLELLRDLLEPVSLNLALSKAFETAAAENISLQDASKIELRRRIAASASIVDQEKVLARKTLLESASLTDAESDTASLFRAEAAFVALNDSDVRNLDHVLTQQIFVDDTVRDVAQQVRSLQEVATISDFEKLRTSKVLDEQVLLLDEAAKSLTKILNEKPEAVADLLTEVSIFVELTESLSLNDRVNAVADLQRTVVQTVDAADAFKYSLKTGLNEQAQVLDAEQYVLSKPAVETVQGVDAATKLVDVNRAEDVNIQDVTDKKAELFRFLNANLTLTDSDIKQFDKPLSEQLNVRDGQQTLLLKQFEEDVPLVSFVQFSDFKTFGESLTVTDQALRQAELFRRRAASLSALDSQSTSVLRQLNEDTLVNDEATSRLKKLIVERQPVIDNFSKKLAVVAGQNLVVRDNLAKTLSFSKSESFAVSDRKERLFNKVFAEAVNVSYRVAASLPAQVVANNAEISKLHRAVARLSKLHRADGDIEKF